MKVWPSECQAGTSFSCPWPPQAGSHSHDPVTGADRSPPNAASPILPHVVPRLPTPSHTSAVAVVIFVPPEAPTTIFTFFVLSTKMEGHIEDIGCLPVGDTDAEAQFSACSSQTSSSCSMSKPRVPVSTSLTQLMCPVQFLGIPPSPALMSLTLLPLSSAGPRSVSHGTDLAV